MNSQAWSTQGHQITASLASARLTAKARLEVDRLLALEPGETLASISTWADEHRNLASAPWHYVNVPNDNCNYDPERDCPDGKCVVDAIAKQLEILSSGTSDDKRLTALKYVVHLVADVHQPLHAGYLEDRGGKTYQLQAFMRGSNLHALWDTGLIKNLNEDVDVTTKRLLTGGPLPQAAHLNMVRAAEESCRIVGTPGFHPDRKVGLDYIEQFAPTLERRLSLGGSRLAGILNRVFR